MAGKAQKTQQELERTMIKLQKAAEALKTLEVKRKQLMEQTRIERLCSRGEILEGFLKEPLQLTDAEIRDLLEIMFRSSFTQHRLDDLLRKKETEAKPHAE